MLSTKVLANINRQWCSGRFALLSTSCKRLGDDIKSALNTKEAPVIEADKVLSQGDKRHDQITLISLDRRELISSITGVPEEHIKGRRVKIAKTVKNAMQSGTDNVGTWSMEFDTRQRWENPLMGWSSSGDPLSNLEVQFNSKTDAIEFCEKNGWEWFIEEESVKKPRVKSYAFNFSWDKKSRVSTK